MGRRGSVWLMTAAVFAAGCGRSNSGGSAPAAAASAKYEDLVKLFAEWREFQQPKRVAGVPDYGPAAMAAQYRDLGPMQVRLGSIDPTHWPVPQQVDFQLVRAEMNGLEFDHRVLKPWERDPAFYLTVFAEESDQPAHEGPYAWGGVDLWKYSLPLNDKDAAEIATALGRIPPLLAQARVNLTGDAKDLWTYGVKPLEGQSADLAAFEAKVKDATPSLLPVIAKAKAATDSFALWVKGKAETKSGLSGVGADNYTWYLHNVQLLPYSWSDEVTLMRRELARAHAFLRLEEERNRRLPPQTPVASEAEFTRRFDAGLKQYMAFLADRQIMTIKPFDEPALRAKLGSFRAGPRDFFTEVDYRDPEVMRTHGYHWFDLARMKNEPHPSPIRRGPLLYNIFNTRTEGFATGWEEMMLQAGMFDANPHSRELIYVLLGQRAARALGDLMMHGNQMSLADAAKFAATNTPRGWLRESAATVWFEQHLYLQQPGYGTSYLMGKIEVEKLLRDRAEQLGAGFTMKRFMDEFNAVGLIPISMVRWELAGPSPGLAELLTGQ